MRILFDQGTPVAIRQYLPHHEIKTALEQGWSTLLNGELLAAAQDAGFDVFLTTDTHLADQQNLTGRKLAIVVLSRNRWRSILGCIDDVVAAVNKATPGSYTVVKI